MRHRGDLLPHTSQELDISNLVHSYRHKRFARPPSAIGIDAAFSIAEAPPYINVVKPSVVGVT
ncbi:MAG: hypothetical protein IJU19_07945 [Bacteroidales bacterium]|nr:hypothetical protein [Bacteroidales bacterium]